LFRKAKKVKIGGGRFLPFLFFIYILISVMDDFKTVSARIIRNNGVVPFFFFSPLFCTGQTE